MGTAVVEALGVDLTGKWLDAAENLTASYEAVDARLKRSVLERRATYGRAPLVMNATKKHLMIETVTVPLARDGETVDMLMGCSIMEVLTERGHPLDPWESRQG